MAKIYGTESDTPSARPLTQPSVITSGEIYECSKHGRVKKDDKKQKSLKSSKGE